MAKAIFDREFHWNRPGKPYGFGARPSPVPQHFPQDFINAAIAAGAARAVPKAKGGRARPMGVASGRRRRDPKE